MGSKQTSPELATQPHLAARQMTKPTSNFMKRRVSEDKEGVVVSSSKIKPTLSGTRQNAIAYSEYLDQSKARSPKLYTSKHLQQ